MRKKFRDIVGRFADRDEIVAEHGRFVRSLEPIRRREIAATRLGSQSTCCERISTSDVCNQNEPGEEAPMGTVPDKEKGHAPIQLVDYVQSSF